MRPPFGAASRRCSLEVEAGSATMATMTVTDLLRSARSSARSSARGARDALAAPVSGQPARWSHPAVAGAACATLSALVVVLPALVVWVASPQSTVDWPQALGVGSALWLLAGGGHIVVDGVTVTVVPILLTGLFAWSATVGARWTLRETDMPRTWHGWVPGSWLRAMALWFGGYAGCAGLWALATLLAPVRPSPATVALPVLVLPALAAVAALWLERGITLSPRAGDRGMPPWLASAGRAAVQASALLLLAGFVAVATQVVLHLDAVRHLHHELGPDLAGGLVLVAAQAAMLGNFALWAVSFASGAGFSAGAGSQIVWSGADGALLPLVPVLGALPPPGTFPSWVEASVAVPVVVGLLVSWRALRRLPPRASAGSMVLAVAATVGLTALGLALVAALAGGSAGQLRLTGIGAPPDRMGVLLAGELALGAALPLAWGLWRVRRLRRSRRR